MLTVPAALALAACGGGQAPSVSGTPNAGATGASEGPVVTTATAPGLGTVLVTSGGRTLYVASASCTGGCLRVWRPLVLPPGAATPGAARGITGLTVASQGGSSRQVAYRGHLLYTFTGDTKPGEVNGNGIDSFGGHWTAATLSPAAPGTTSPRTSQSPAVSPPATAAPGGGYGDTDHDGDCRPGYGDTDHDGDCRPGSGPGYGPGPGPGYGPGWRGGYGDTDHDGDCRPGYGDTDHDGDCGPG